MSEFVHLHLHSEGSLLDGMCRTKALLKRAVHQNMRSVAITDHGAMYKCIEFYKNAQESQVKPIIGCEVYVTPGSRFERNPRGGSNNYYHLILLAKNFEGYKNLMRLVSRGHMEGFYYKPRVDRETLAEFSDGLVCLSACLGAEVPQLIVQGKPEEARRAAEDHLAIFGRENYFFELQDHGIEDQYRVNEALLEMSKSMNIPLVATNDVHYVCAEDHIAHDLLLCIQTGATVDDPKRFKFDGDQFFLASAEEMEKKFGHIPEALSNTLRVAEMCNVDLQFDQVSLPQFPLPEGYTPDSYLLELCKTALPERFPNLNDEHVQRLDYELSVINPKGFASYFLIVADFVKHAQERGVSVRARGSAAGSIVAYLLGITNVDPLRYTLMFERFLNPDRVEMPDIDLDFADTRREEMIDYAIERYGKDHVAQIGTLGTLGARAAIRDAGRALKVPLPEVDRIAKLIQGLNPSIDESIQIIPELNKLYAGDPNVRSLIDRARSVEGIVRTSGIHAAGVVISRDPLTDCVPLQRAGEVKVMRDGKEVTETRQCTQYDMESISKIGLLKVDFLGLRNLTVVDNCIRMIRERKDPNFSVESIPEDDKRTFDMLSEGHGIGVFQLESSGMRQMIKALKPRIFDDLVPVVALYRPGPLQSGMVEQFIECRHGRRQVTYLDQRLEPLLKDTYGVMLYQEQIMQISMQIGGFKPGDAEKLRKAMSKKIADLMAKFKDKFVDGAVERGVKRDIAGTIYDQMAAFAAYGFNKAHSAAYGALAYETAYLKANYQVEYLSALLTSLMENKDRLAATIEECRRMGVKVLSPDINESAVDFAPEPGSETAIRFGLAAIKGLSPNAIEGILTLRRESGPFTSLFDVCERSHTVTGLNKGNLEALIKAGAFGSLCNNRRQLMESVDIALSLRQQAKRNAQSGQVTLFGLLGTAAEAVSPRVQYPQAKDVKDYPAQELLEFEKDLLGLYVSNHPLHAYRDFFKKRGTTDTTDLKQFKDKEPASIGGLVCEFRNHQTKKGDPMMFLTVEDLTGRTDVVLFKEVLQKYGDLIEKNRALLIRGKVSVRAGAGGRGKKGNSQPEETDDCEYSILADEISLAQAVMADLDPWSEPGTVPLPSPTAALEEPVSWEMNDGNTLDWEAEGESLSGLDTVAMHWVTRPMLPDNQDVTVNVPTNEYELPVATAPVEAPALFGIEASDSVLVKLSSNPQANTTSQKVFSSVRNLNPSTEIDANIAEAGGGEPGAAEVVPVQGKTRTEKSVDDILDDVTTIRDIYGVLPKKGEPPVRLYPPSEPVAQPVAAASVKDEGGSHPVVSEENGPYHSHSLAAGPAVPHRNGNGSGNGNGAGNGNGSGNGNGNGNGLSPGAVGDTRSAKPITADAPATGAVKVKTLQIRLSAERSTAPVLREIAELIANYGGGPHPVELTVETLEGKRTLRSGGAGVKPSAELVRLLQEKCGNQSVKVA